MDTDRIAEVGAAVARQRKAVMAGYESGDSGGYGSSHASAPSRDLSRLLGESIDALRADVGRN